MLKRILLAITITIIADHLVIGQSVFKDWPKGKSPEEIGLRVAELFILSPHGVYGGNVKSHIPYFEVCTWYGALNRIAKK